MKPSGRKRSRDDNESRTHDVVSDGNRHGPFDTFDEAREWAIDNCDSWQVVPSSDVP